MPGAISKTGELLPRAGAAIVRRTFCAALAGIALALAPCSFAQTAPLASRTVPESLAPAHTQAQGSVDLPETSPTRAPPGSEALTIKLGAVVIAGLDPAMPASVRAVAVAERDALAGKTVSIADIYAAAGRIEAAFGRAGLVLSRVTLPRQHLADGGAVQLMIVDGFIEGVDVSALPMPVRGAVRRRLAPLIGRHGLTLERIERHVLLAGDTPGVRLRSILVRGNAAGSTRIVITAQYRPLSGSLGFDNNLGRAYQYEAFTAQISANSVLGLGEQVYASLTTGPDFHHLFDADPRRRIGAVGVVVPIGDDGLTINPEYTRVDTTPRQAAPIAGLYERAALRVSYPLVRSRRANLTVTAGFELSSEFANAVGLGTISHDRIRLGTIGAAYGRALGQTTMITADGQFSVGLAGLGARTAAAAASSGVGLSRQGSSPDFRKINGHAALDQQVGAGFDLTATVRAQAGFSGALPAAAQFSLDGSDVVSSFALGSINVDSGMTGRIELGRPFQTGAPLITPYGFAVLGFGHVADPTVIEAGNLRSWAAGAGLHMLIGAGGKGLATMGALELSHGHVTAAPGSTPVQASDPTRVTASLSFHF